MADSKLTDGDLARHIDRVLSELEKFPAHGELRDLCNQLIEDARGRVVTHRCPYNLLFRGAINEVTFSIEPFVSQRLTHLVVSDETAQKWDLVDWKVSCVAMFAGAAIGRSGSAEQDHSFRTPLTAFAVSNYKKDSALERVLSWVSPKVQPGNRATLHFTTKDGYSGIPQDFEGLLWADSTYNYK